MADVEQIVTEFIQRGEAELAAAFNNIANAQDKYKSSAERAASVSGNIEKSLSANSVAAQKMSDALRNAGGQIGETFKKFDDAREQTLRLNKALDDQEREYKKLGQSLSDARLIYGESSTQVNKLSDKLAEAEAEFGRIDGALKTSAGSLDKYHNELSGLVEEGVKTGKIAPELLKIGTASNQSLTGVKGLLQELSRAPGVIGQAAGGLDSLIGKFGALSGAGGAGLGALEGVALVGSAVAVAVGVIDKAVKSAEEYALAVGKISKASGASTEFVSALAQAADDASIAVTGTGVSVNEIGAAITRFNVLIGRGADEQGNFTQASVKVKQAAKELGVSFEDASGKLRPLQELLPDLAEGFRRIGPGAQATSLAKQLGLNEMLPLLLQGKDGLKDLMDAAKASGLVIGEELPEQIRKANAAMDSLQDRVSGVGLKLGAFFSQIKGDGAIFANSFVGSAEILSKVFSGLAGGAKPTITDIRQLRDYSRDLFASLERQLPNGSYLFGLRDLAKKQIESSFELITNNEKLIANYEEQGRALQAIADREREATQAANNRLAAGIAASLQGTGFSGSFSGTDQLSLETTRKQEAALAAQVGALARASSASDALARSQGLLKGIIDAASGSIAAQGAPLDKFAKVQAALALAQGKTSPQEILTSASQRALNESYAKKKLSQSQFVADSLALKTGAISPGQALELVPQSISKKYIEEVKDIGATTKDAKVQVDAFNQAKAKGVDLAGQQLANQPVPIVRQTSSTFFPSNDKLTDAAKNVLAAEDKLSNLQKTAEGSNKITAQVVADAKAANKSTSEVTDAQVNQMKVAAQNNLDLAKANQELAKSKQQFGEFASQVGKEQVESVVVGFGKVGEKAVETLRNSIKDAGKDLGADPFALRVDAVLNKQPVEAFAASVAGTPIKQRIDLVLDTLGKTQAQLAAELDRLPKKVQIDAALKFSGAQNLDQLIAQLQAKPTTELQARVQVKLVQELGAANIPDAIAKLNTLKSQEIQYVLKVLGVETADQAATLLKNKIVELAGKPYSVTIDANTKPAEQGLTKVEDAKLTTKELEFKSDPLKVISIIDDLNINHPVIDKMLVILGNTVGADAAIDHVNNRAVLDKTATITIVQRYVTEGKSATCFARGTLIDTPMGAAPIERIEAGDAVWTYDHLIGEVVMGSVVQTFRNHADEMADLLFSNGAWLRCTLLHPIYSVDRDEYVDAKGLHLGECVMMRDGRKVRLVSTLLAGGEDTFNFEVETHHCYFAAGILVHNYSEKIDGQLGSLRNSLSSLALSGLPGEFDRAQRMVMTVLLPGLSARPNVTTNNTRTANVNPVFNVSSVGEARASLEIVQALAGGF